LEGRNFSLFLNLKTVMKKVILTAAAALAIFATSFAQNATTAPAPKMKTKMTKSTPKPAMDAPAQGTPAQTTPAQGTPATAEKSKGHGKAPDEARGEGKGRNEGGGVNKSFGLSPEQETKFKAINEGHKAATKAVQADASLAADAKKAQIDLLKSKYESDVQGVMNTDQFAKWKEMRASRGDKREGRPEGAEGMGHREGGDHKKGDHKKDGGAAPAPANGSATPAVPAEGMKMKSKKPKN
jgi:hypothetical protein